MKLPKSLLQTIALAVTVTVINGCSKDKVIDPKNPKDQQKELLNCPACGMG